MALPSPPSTGGPRLHDVPTLTVKSTFVLPSSKCVNHVLKIDLSESIRLHPGARGGTVYSDKLATVVELDAFVLTDCLARVTFSVGKKVDAHTWIGSDVTPPGHSVLSSAMSCSIGNRFVNETTLSNMSVPVILDESHEFDKQLIATICFDPISPLVDGVMELTIMYKPTWDWSTYNLPIRVDAIRSCVRFGTDCTPRPAKTTKSSILRRPNPPAGKKIVSGRSGKQRAKTTKSSGPAAAKKMRNDALRHSGSKKKMARQQQLNVKKKKKMKKAHHLAAHPADSSVWLKRLGEALSSPGSNLQQ